MEDCAGGRVLIVAALGMPLYPKDEVVGIGALYGLDDAIVRGARYHP